MFINCTPHVITVLSLDGLTTVLSLPKGSVIPRVSAESKVVTEVGGVPLTSVVYGQVENLPVEQPGVYLVVSGKVRDALPSRRDLCSPGELVRDTQGNPKGCLGLVVNT